MAGQFVYLNGWQKIRQVANASLAHLEVASQMAGMIEAPIVTMNEIYLEGAGWNLTKFEIEYAPRTR